MEVRPSLPGLLSSIQFSLQDMTPHFVNVVLDVVKGKVSEGES